MEDNFQENLRPIRLYDQNGPHPQVTKVGILPFMAGPDGKGGELQFLVMKPKERASHLGDPRFQLAKGTRRINVNGHWLDMRPEDFKYADDSFLEPSLKTALREGLEEIGLKQSNIKRIYDMGGYAFTSATKGKQKHLHMFAAEVTDRNDFETPEHSTAEVRWMVQREFEELGRADHVKVLQEIAASLGGKSKAVAR